MTVLKATTETITVELLAAVDTNNVQLTSEWRVWQDQSPKPTWVPDSLVTSVSGAAPVTLVTSPPPSRQAIVESMSAFNADVEPVTIVFRHLTSSTSAVIYRGVLAPNEMVKFSGGEWSKKNANGDTISVGATGANGVDGSDGALSVAEVEIDFGSVPIIEKTFTVVDAGVSATSKIIAVQSGKAATDKQSDENEMDSLILSCSPASGSFVLYARAVPGPVAGKFKINYQFS